MEAVSTATASVDDVHRKRAIKQRNTKQRLLRDEAFFAKAMFPEHIKGKVPKFHQDLYDIYGSGADKIVLAAPRDHAKTTITCLIHVLFMAVTRGARYIVIISNTKPTAKLALDDIKVQIEHNPRIRHYFGDLRDPNKWTEDDIELRFDDDPMNNCKIVARGAGQQIRGSRWRGRRPDLIIIDDLEDEDNTGTSEQRLKLQKWFDAAVIPALSKDDDGQLIVIGTVLHYDSLLNQLLDPNKYPEFVSRKFKSIDTGIDGRSYALWPERYSLERLLRMRKVYARRGRLHIFMQEYQNEAMSEELRRFKKSYKRSYAGYVVRHETERQAWLVVTARQGVILAEPEVVPIRITVGVDLAISKEDWADYTVLMVVGTDHRNRSYILEIIRERFDPSQTIDAIFDVNRRYRPELISLETNAFQECIERNLVDAMHERGVYVPYEPVKHRVNKESRILELQPRFAVGGMWWRDGEDVFEAELFDWDKVAHDDQLDALEMAISISARAKNISFKDIAGVAVASDEQIGHAVEELIDMFGKEAWKVL